MRKTDKNKLAMYKSVKTVIAGREALWNGLPAFVNAYAAFNQKLQTLESHAYNQQLALVGVSAVKDSKRDAIADRAYAMSSSLAAFAVLNNNVELIDQMKISRYELQRAPKSRILQHLDLILIKATEFVSQLGDFGVDQTSIDELQVLRDELDIMLSAPRNAIVERKVLTKQIIMLMKDIDALLKFQMDKLMVVLAEEHPEFFAAYKNARMIVDHRNRRSGTGQEFDLSDNPDVDDGV